MKKQYIQPNIIVVELEFKHMIASSTVEVQSMNYDEGSMTDLARENLWGNDEQVEESKFWF